jgi:hypothetical protein
LLLPYLCYLCHWRAGGPLKLQPKGQIPIPMYIIIISLLSDIVAIAFTDIFNSYV